MRSLNFRLVIIIFLMTFASIGSAGEISGNSLAKLAKEGNIAAIMAISDQDPKSGKDTEAYKWLVVARDFGHRSADNAIADLMEISSLRYDDDGLATGVVHYELGVAYLTGADGLPKDFKKARKNFRTSLSGMNYVVYDYEDERKQLTGEARSIFDSFFPPSSKMKKSK